MTLTLGQANAVGIPPLDPDLNCPTISKHLLSNQGKQSLEGYTIIKLNVLIRFLKNFAINSSGTYRNFHRENQISSCFKNKQLKEKKS